MTNEDRSKIVTAKTITWVVEEYPETQISLNPMLPLVTKETQMTVSLEMCHFWINTVTLLEMHVTQLVLLN